MNSATLDAKRFVYRYALFIHGILGTPSSGQAELPGNDFVVSLGNFRTTNGAGHKVGSSEQQSATLMHEFGHTLGLRHGGDTDVNCKPNYLSIMSYAFQFPSLVPSRPLDYSRETIGPLNENVLNESNGIPAGSFPQTIIGSDGMGNNRTATGIHVVFKFSSVTFIGWG